MICINDGKNNLTTFRFAGSPLITFDVADVINQETKKETKTLVVVLKGHNEDGDYVTAFPLINVMWIKLVPDNLLI